jgi:23S rRNA (uracil1939-C5)-methyltransferase
MPRIVEATITELAPGGEGVAIADIGGERRAIFVPGVAPSERVRIEADLDHRPARGRLLKVIEASDARVDPPCRHVEACGGCDWMHLAPSAQSIEHARIVTRLLPPSFAAVVPKMHPATTTSGYRTRARVHIEATHKGVVVGMFGKRTRTPAPVDTCLVLDPVLDRARAGLTAVLEGAHGKGEAQLSLGTPSPDRRAVIDLRWSGDLPGSVFARLERAVEEGTIAGARVFAGAVRLPATIGDPTPWITGADGVPLRLAPGGFSQASEEANALLASRVLALADEKLPKADVVELYAGAGNLTVLLAKDRKVIAVESDRDACDAMRANLVARRFEAKVVCADATTYALPPKTKLIVLDPPRTGARAVAAALAARPQDGVVLYVSCDPPTLARDLAILEKGGFHLEALELFEMFPQTSHIETLALAVRSKKGG